MTDAAVLTTHCDGSLVVVSYGKTTDTELGDSLTNLANVHATMLGSSSTGCPATMRPAATTAATRKRARRLRHSPKFG